MADEALMAKLYSEAPDSAEYAGTEVWASSYVKELVASIAKALRDWTVPTGPVASLAPAHPSSAPSGSAAVNPSTTRHPKPPRTPVT